MSQEARLVSNRTQVLEKLTTAIHRLEEAQVMVLDAQRIARSAPAGYRALPGPIRRELDSVLARIRKAQTKIRLTPLTKQERNSQVNGRR